ncbi:MAG TPA: hypothetical protein VEF76_11490 [Patescibacteria group bacterium]|nr:hypothetical protein [Patescibacteria group bacterium]
MSKTIPTAKYQYDIGLDQGAGAHLVSWSTGLMVFFATLALAINLGLNTITQNWIGGLSGSLTVEVKPTIGGQAKVAADETVSKILAVAQTHPAVDKARVLERAEIFALLRPWLGDKPPEGLPLPSILDITLKPGADAAPLTAEIAKLAPEAAVDNHADTLDDVQTLVATARFVVLLLTTVIVLLAAGSIAGIVRSKLAIHAAEIETLHLVGASDEYIARQFRHHTLKGALKGAIGGVVTMILAILGVSYMTHTIDTAVFPHIRLMPLEWALIAAAPVVFGSLLAHFTAQRTVMRELARLP